MPTLVLGATPIFPTRVIPPVPVGPPLPTGGPPDLGTVRVFADMLRQGNVVVGEHNGTCLHVRAPNMWLCHANWTLEDVDPDKPGGKTLRGSLVGAGCSTSTPRTQGGDLRGHRRLRRRCRRVTRQVRNE